MKKILSFRNDWKGLGKWDKVGGVGYYRIVKPLSYLPSEFQVFDLGDPQVALAKLQKAGVNWTLDQLIPNLIRDCDLVFMKNISHPGGLAYFAGSAKHYNKPLLVDMDDNYLAVDDLNPNRKYFQETDIAQVTHKELWKAATAMTVSTEPLVEAYSQFNKNIHVLENYNDVTDWQFEKKKRDRVVIGWAVSQTHEADFKILEPVVTKLWQKYGEKIIFAICGGLKPSVAKKLPQGSYVVTSGTKTMSEYHQRLAEWGFDIGLAPIQENTFNDGKSHGKWMEYANYRIPTVASNFGPYKRVVEDGSTGYLCTTTEEWVGVLSKLIDSEETRKRVGQAAYDVVVNNHQWRDHAWRWGEVFDRYIGGGYAQ